MDCLSNSIYSQELYEEQSQYQRNRKKKRKKKKKKRAKAFGEFCRKKFAIEISDLEGRFFNKDVDYVSARCSNDDKKQLSSYQESFDVLVKEANEKSLKFLITFPQTT
ncbi:hypothetical protein V1477_000693 [Vespula maculifrons]|uniref:Uncharacterized protein n=1 Tax=Vespula maculifrons TaxID=7453 RepID=A0ABD2D2B8_VESMC